MNQGYPLIPTICNIVVDAVVRHCISLVEGVVGGQYRWVEEVLHHAAFFYMDDGLIVSKEPVWLQGAFDTLAGLFARLGFWKNPGRGLR